MRKLCVVFGTLACALALATAAQAQSGDIAFGISTVHSKSGADATGNYFPQSIGGGTFPGFSGDFLIKHHFGVGGEVFWRAGQNNYANFQPFRPIFWDIDGVYAPPLGKHAALELDGGIGAASIRFYQPFFSCDFTGCTNYTSINHFMGVFGGGVKLYVWGNVFVRPEARVYLIHNNVEFSSGVAERLGVSIGYTFGGSSF